MFIIIVIYDISIRIIYFRRVCSSVGQREGPAWARGCHYPLWNYLYYSHLLNSHLLSEVCLINVNKGYLTKLFIILQIVRFLLKIYHCENSHLLFVCLKP